MPSLTTQGIVLRFVNYRDHDRILTLLTPEHGRIDALSRGCRRPKSPFLPASEPFVHGEYVLFQTGDRNTLTSCTLTDTFYPLRLDSDRLTCASYLLGLSQASSLPGEDARELYQLLLQGLYHLAYCDSEIPLSIVASFLLLFAAITGYRPRLKHCAHCRGALNIGESALFDWTAGGLVCASCAASTAYRLTSEQIHWMQETLSAGLTAEQQKTDASDMVPLLRRYMESKLEMPIKAGRLLPQLP